MKFSCDKCGTRYQVSDDKVRGKLARLRCRRCQELVTVDGTALNAPPSDGQTRSPPNVSAQPPSTQSDAPTAARRLPDAQGGWHAVIGRDQVGPLDASELIDAVRAGRVTRRTYVWRGDLGNWRPAGEIEALLPLFTMDGTAAPHRPSSKAAVRRGEAAPAPAEGQRGIRREAEAAPEATPEEASRDEDAGVDEQSKLRGAVLGSSSGSQPPVNRTIEPAAQRPTTEGESQDPTTEDAAQDPTTEVESQAPTTGGESQDDDLGSLFEQASRDAEEQEFGFEPGGAGSKPEPPSDAGLGDFFEAGEKDDEALDPFTAALAEEVAASAAADPFSQFSASEVPDESARETTQMFILASGVKKQRSPVRIAAFVAGMAGLVLALGFVVSRVGGFQIGDIFNVGSERRQAQAWESTGKESDLRDRLLGIKKEEVQEKAVRGSTRDASVRGGETAAEQRLREELEAERGAVDPERREMLSALYEKGDRGAISIRPRRDRAEQGPVTSAESPIDPEVIHRRIADTQPAFETCLQQELRRNPSFRAGRAELVLTVMPSGVVRQASISDRMLDRSDLGRCITLAARRIMLPGFAGEDPVDIVIPLLLSSSP